MESNDNKKRAIEEVAETGSAKIQKPEKSTEEEDLKKDHLKKEKVHLYAYLRHMMDLMQSSSLARERDLANTLKEFFEQGPTGENELRWLVWETVKIADDILESQARLFAEKDDDRYHFLTIEAQFSIRVKMMKLAFDNYYITTDKANKSQKHAKGTMKDYCDTLYGWLCLYLAVNPEESKIASHQLGKRLGMEHCNHYLDPVFWECRSILQQSRFDLANQFVNKDREFYFYLPEFPPPAKGFEEKHAKLLEEWTKNDFDYTVFIGVNNRQ
jgi:hypothetical protein